MKQALVVDDSKIVRKVTRRILESFSYSIEEAADGQQALDACKNSMPDLVMLDWNMPVMDGLEFLIALRAMPNGTDPKVIFCTTENEFSRIQTAIQSGADEYVMKPFDEEIVKSKLEQLGLL